MNDFIFWWTYCWKWLLPVEGEFLFPAITPVDTAHGAPLQPAAVVEEHRDDPRFSYPEAALRKWRR